MTQDPIPRNRDATNLRILDAAFVVLSDDGFARFGVNCVARAAGCDKKLIIGISTESMGYGGRWACRWLMDWSQPLSRIWTPNLALMPQ